MARPITYLSTLLISGLLFSQVVSAHTKYEVRETENGGYVVLNTVTGALSACERQSDGYQCKNYVPVSDEKIVANNAPTDWHTVIATNFQSGVSHVRHGLLYVLAEENFEYAANLSKEAFKRLFNFTDQLKARL
ncbi:MAG: hypothetical protein ABJK39_12855 [Hyphomicrobiales bacterium]